MTTREEFKKNAFVDYRNIMSLGVIPDNFKPVTSTKINNYYIKQAIEILNNFDCYTPIIQISDKGLLIFKPNAESNIGIVIAPAVDDEEDEEGEEA
jgi:hypothetical protein